jgi:hypothetical protein
MADWSPFPLVRLFTIPFPKETSPDIAEMNSQINKTRNIKKEGNMCAVHKGLIRSTELIWRAAGAYSFVVKTLENVSVQST